MPEIPRKTAPVRTSADADERMAEIDENFMTVPFFDPAISLCQKEYAAATTSSVRYHTNASEPTFTGRRDVNRRKMGKQGAPLIPDDERTSEKRN